MTFSRYFWQYLIPAIALFGAALWCGVQKTMIFALTGFLGAFLIAVSLIIEGGKKLKNCKKTEKNL